MTNEEAIAYGKECLSWNKFSKDMKMYQFIEMAIKALSQEPCDDVVSRQAVLEQLKGWLNYELRDMTNPIYYLEKRINNLPSVNPQPCDDAISREMALKECYEIVIDGGLYRVIQEETLLGLPSVTHKSGKWIKGKDEYGTNHFTCPFCGHDIATKAENWDDNYCANCGAKMESEDKE